MTSKLIVPHDFQQTAVHNTIKALRQGQRVLLTSPPGSGKTVMIAELTRRELRDGRRVLIIAQRREILQQTILHLRGIGIDTSQIGAIYPDPHIDTNAEGPVQIASMATLIQRNIRPVADMLILDEAHHAPASGHDSVLDVYRSKRLVGVTATPVRMDGRGLGDTFNLLITAAMPSTLIKARLLAKPRSFSVPEEFLPNLRGIRRAMGDYAIPQLGERMNQERLIGNLVEHYRHKASGKTAIVFATTLPHSRHIVERFITAGVSAEHLDSATPLVERDGIVQRLENGRTQVVVNVGILHEGFNMPHIYAVILARPTMSLCLYLQQVGRGLRRFGNRRPLILDHARNVNRFGLPEADREFSLTMTVEKAMGLSHATKNCPRCHSIVAAGCIYCPECGLTLREINPVPREEEGLLSEITPVCGALLEIRLRAYLESRGEENEEWIQKVVELWTARNSETELRAG